MNRARSAALGLLLAVACQKREPPPRPVEPSPEQEARALVENARREVESAPPEAPAPGAAVYVPVLSKSSPMPFVVFLHGLGGSGRDLAEGLRLKEMADVLGFAFVAPEGHVDRSGRRFWNATATCCNFDDVQIDHVAELRAWITRALADPRVDPRRVYIVGFSNGGFMAYRAACELGSLLAGNVSIAGAGLGDAELCRPQQKLSVIQIHGDRDPIVKFDGGYLFADTRRPRMLSAEKSLAYWAEFDGCDAEPGETGHLDLDPRVPGAESSVIGYRECSGHRVELWRIPGGDHTAGLTRLGVKAIWDFIVADAAVATAAPSP
jgi:polyhydroxybutyrate depolymerase